MIATVVITVLLFAVVMGVLVITPVLFQRQNMSGSLFDPYYEQQCIDYIHSWWLLLIAEQDEYMGRREEPVYLAGLLSLTSVLVAMALERGHQAELKTWFADWMKQTPPEKVQLHIMLVGWQHLTQNKPALRDALLVQILQQWNAWQPSHGKL
ncbi:MAG TPA: hypothetical protein VK099_09290 [Alcanivoracaceae bacterium]|nr:hypothetical protein [Alcanivoracaceae bacterium]